MSTRSKYSPLKQDRYGLIDGDIILHASGYVADKEETDEQGAKAILDSMILNIRDTLALTDATFFISDTDENNFRYKVAKTHPYKGNRKDKEKPKHYPMLRQYMIDKWDGKLTKDMEADDGMGLAQTKTTIICTIDKDLDMIPGWHYNWNHYSIYHVSKDQAVKHFWTQMLTGDNTDNIKGIYRLGPKKAYKLFEGSTEELSLYSVVIGQYVEHFKEDARSRFEENYDLLKIKGAPIGFRELAPEVDYDKIDTKTGGASS